MKNKNTPLTPLILTRWYYYNYYLFLFLSDGNGEGGEGSIIIWFFII